MSRFSKFITPLLAVALTGHVNSALACAMCYGSRVDSPLAQGMNWGIFSLLGMVVCVLGGVASFFIYLAKKSAATSAMMPNGESLPSTPKT